MSETDQGLGGEHPERPLLNLLADAVGRADWEDEDDVLEMLRLLTLLGHQLPREKVAEIRRDIDRQEAVGPLLNPGEWDHAHFDMSHKAKLRCDAVLAMMDKLEEAEEWR